MNMNRIRHTAVISNLLLITAHFSGAVLKHLGNKAADYMFFPLEEKPVVKFLHRQKRKYGGLDETMPLSESDDRFDPYSYSKQYSTRINAGLMKLFPNSTLSVRNLREVISNYVIL